jgi:Fe-S oxidoreductase
MSAIMVAALAMFAWSASRRWQLLQVGEPSSRLDHLSTRIQGVWRYAFRQEKMDYYNPAGIAHKAIFTGFLVLLLRTLILWGRAFYPKWNFFILGPTDPIGEAYEFAKDVIATFVVLGVLVFLYYRVVRPQKRMSLSGEGILILLIIATMMIADMVYDGASLVLASKKLALCSGPSVVSPALGAAAKLVATPSQCDAINVITAPLSPDAHATYSLWPSPAGSFFAVLFTNLRPGALIFLSRAGFWTHSTLVLVFLNLLPHSKHFHVITAIPNVFLRDLRPAGRLRPMAETAEKLGEKVMAAGELPDPTAAAVGVSRIEHFEWKALLDFYTCTECGRCSDNCPAHQTGKILSPKHLTLALRDHLYHRENELVHRADEPKSGDAAAAAPAIDTTAFNLVPNAIHPDVLWACTTCRACEEQCPVLISYVDKIIDMRRNLVLVRNEFPHELQKPFQAMEVNGNPWNLSRVDRAAWSDGLDVPTMAEKPAAEVLYWVGCAASYDDRAKKIARSIAKLLKQAGVDFAILGQEESCTGDPARRAGNEFLFAMLAEGNAATLNGYKDQGGAKKVITTCPHCFNSLKNEYPDFGAKLEVVHHTDYLLGLLAEGRLTPTRGVSGRVVYHDSCYLGRYNGVYESPREILRRIPGVDLVEAEYWNKQRGLCCGAGGAQMWMEEQNKDRVNVKRTLQLVDSLAHPAPGSGSTHPEPASKTIASACPFCMQMLTDGLKAKSIENDIQQMDVAELLEQSCVVVEVQPAAPTPEPQPPSEPARDEAAE